MNLVLDEGNVIDVYRKLADKQNIEQAKMDKAYQRFRELVNHRNDREQME